METKTFRDTPGITDAKLKADSGSLSRYSFKFNLTYSGPNLGDFSAKDQPNPDGTVGSFQTALGGTMGVRYRLNSQSSVGLSSGVKMIHPFHGMDRFDVNNPALTYDYATRVRGLQMRNSPGFILRTVPEFTRIGQFGYLLDTHSIVYEIGLSGFSIGADMAFGYFLYNRAYERKDGKAALYSLEINPVVKYRVSDKLGVVTSTNLAWWSPRAGSDRLALNRKSLTQKLGLGYSVSRDVYLNPYLTFTPQKIALSTATLNVSAIFSIL